MGISTIKGISEALKIPIVGVSSLEGLAYNIKEFNGITCSLIDAKNNNVYCGIFNEKYKLIEDYIADNIDLVIQKLSKYNSKIIFIGDGAIEHKNKIEEVFKENAYFAKEDENFQTSVSIGKCAYNKYINKEYCFADELLPLYLRKTQAERMKELNAKSSN